MKKYIYRNTWSSTVQYYINNAVIHSGVYYKALIDNINVPTSNTGTWEELSATAWVETSEIPLSYQDIVNSDTLSSILTSDNGLGLYKFPLKSILGATHFQKLGLNLNYNIANSYLDGVTSEKPVITGIYVMQGERKKNVITQGVCTAAVETIGFDITVKGVNKIGTDLDISDGSNTYDVRQTSNLGTAERPVAFPWFDGSNFRLFPVINISRDREAGSGKYIWRYREDAVTQLYVMNRGANNTEQYVWGTYNVNDSSDTKYNGALATPDDLYKNGREASVTYQSNVKTNKFCLFTPDIILDKSISIPSQVYLKPVKKIPVVRSMSFSADSYDYSTYTKRGDVGNVRFAYKDGLPRLMDPVEFSYNEPVDKTALLVNAEVIQENQISTSSGFSSRMKSILEVYGDDMQVGSAPLSTTLTKYFTASRNANFDAGILINRQYKKVIGYDSTIRPLGPYAGADIPDKHFSAFFRLMFGSPKQNPYYNQSDEYDGGYSIPVLATNLSMRTPPYIGITMPTIDTYLESVYLRGTYADYHNAIVNVCIYENSESYLQSVINSFNILNEQYSIIDYQTIDDLIQKDVYKGDIISQKTFMRVVRWNDKPESMVNADGHNWEYGWKQGKALNIYLQSIVNTYLRTPSKDETFYPYVLSEGTGTKEDIQRDFIWKSESNRMYNESWKINDGYSQLRGTIRLFAYDEMLQNKTNESVNRIRYSNKHISGAFTDAYMSLPSDQYQDYGFEYGEMQKLVVINSILFSIQTSAINQHYSSTQMQSTGDSSEIILGNKQVLAEQYKNLAEFGTRHSESVVNGDLGTYGVDWSNEVIWRIKGSETNAGAVVYGVENLVKSKFVFDIFKLLRSYHPSSNLPQRLYAFEPTGIISSFDGENECVYITFQFGVVSKTLIYSEKNDCFAGMISHDVNFYMQLNNRLFSYNKGSSIFWEHNTGEYQQFHDNNYPFELEFIVNGKSEQDASMFNKEFKAHLINMCPELLNMIEWTTEYQESMKYPFINEQDFWSNPIYEENLWKVPIMPNEKDTNDGPLEGADIFKSFESDSMMRGQWLKVKLTYIRDGGDTANYIYLRSIITNFIISFT